DRGDDRLTGGAGNDTYVFNLGDGVDSIQDIAVPGEGNVIQFGSDISLVDLDLAREQNTLTITFGAFGDAIRLTDFDPSNVNGSLVVETLEFSDGSQASLAELAAATTGTDGNDVINTGPENNVIFARDGDDLVDAGAGGDVVIAGKGNDTLIGGPGNDTLAGGPGNDTYVFNLGDGVDTIEDTAVPGEGNQIVFGP